MKVQRIHSIEQEVEWLYTFDIHCNGFFPLFIILYVAQYYLAPFIMGDDFLSLFVANSLYAMAFAYYHYVSFLGYSGQFHSVDGIGCLIELYHICYLFAC